jgi:hypothetical protein
VRSKRERPLTLTGVRALFVFSRDGADASCGDCALAHPLVSEALITISGSVRSTATVLEVLVATKAAPLDGLDAASA